MNNVSQIVNIMFTVVPIFIAVVFIFEILSIVSPKFRGKMMSRQLKSAKHMVEYAKDDIEEIADELEYATHNSVRNRARAFSGGFSGTQMYCKHCGASITGDSRFCNKCGKEQ